MRAVASLEMRIRVVASFEVSIPWGFDGPPMCADCSWASEQGSDRLNLFPPPPRDPPCVLPNWQWVVPTRHLEENTADLYRRKNEFTQQVWIA